MTDTPHTREFEKFLAQANVAGQGTMPAGTYGGTLQEAKVVQRKRDRSWMLRIIAHLTQNDRYEIEWRNLARSGDDPFLLTRHQERTWREFAQRLNLPAGDIRDQVNALGQMVGTSVTVEIKHTMTGVLARMHADQGVRYATTGGALTATGEVLTGEQRTDLAHARHVRLIEGLRAHRLGLSAAAEACWELAKDQGWVDLGYDTLGLYLASPEIDLKRSEFYRLAAIWDAYVLEGEIAPLELEAGEPSKLEVPLRAIGAGEVTAREALDDVKTLGRADLREKYGQEKPDKPDQDKINTEDDPACPHCGLTVNVNGHALRYHGKTWPAWVTPEMARAAVDAADGRLA